MMIKIDVKNAFRLIPVRQYDLHLLGMFWRDKYYVDRVLPFGLASSPPLWERVSRLLHWIIVNVLNFPHVVHYVDRNGCQGCYGCRGFSI